MQKLSSGQFVLRSPNRSSRGHVSTMKDNQIKCKCGLCVCVFFFLLCWCLMPRGALSVVRGRAVHNEGSRLRGPFQTRWVGALFLGTRLWLVQDKGTRKGGASSSPSYTHTHTQTTLSFLTVRTCLCVCVWFSLLKVRSVFQVKSGTRLKLKSQPSTVV